MRATPYYQIITWLLRILGRNERSKRQELPPVPNPEAFMWKTFYVPGEELLTVVGVHVSKMFPREPLLRVRALVSAERCLIPLSYLLEVGCEVDLETETWFEIDQGDERIERILGFPIYARIGLEDDQK